MRRSRGIYIALGIFLGGLGIHNFYAGYIGRAIAQLLITLLLWWTIITIPAVIVWVIIEMCLVTKDNRGIDFV